MQEFDPEKAIWDGGEDYAAMPEDTIIYDCCGDVYMRIAMPIKTQRELEMALLGYEQSHHYGSEYGKDVAKSEIRRALGL